MSDGSSIDFSVTSGNREILEWYVQKRVKNQNNSSESDHLDKVVTPPSIAMSNVPGKGNASSSCTYTIFKIRHTIFNLDFDIPFHGFDAYHAVLSHSSGPSGLSVSSAHTLDRFQNRYSSPYAGHYHDILGITSSNSGTIPLSVNKHSNTNSYAFEPSPSHHSHSHYGTNESSVSMSVASSSGPHNNRINFRNNSDDILLHPSYPPSTTGTFPRKKEPQRIRIPSNQSVTSKSSTEKFDLRNSPMPTYHIEVRLSHYSHNNILIRSLYHVVLVYCAANY